VSDAYTHIEECWGYDGNPFPGEAVSSSPGTEPHSAEVFPVEELEFRTKVVRGALQGNRKMTFLWSIGPFGGDTGFGKTSLMSSVAHEINADWGARVQREVGIKPDRAKKIAAGFAIVNQQSRNGLYPVAFEAVERMASGALAILPQARDAIVERVGADGQSIADALVETRLAIASAGPPLRPDLLNAFAEGSEEFALAVSEVSETTRIRSGIQYFAFALIVLAAAGVEKVFVAVDQLEDLGKKGALSAAKRRREIGRIRDLLEMEPYASLLHLSFTFHQAAATNLESDWEANRLPSFEPSTSNATSVVVLRGLGDDDQVEELLKAWMEPHRTGETPTEITPFTPDALTALREASEGRPGYALRQANEVFMAAAERAHGAIDGSFVREHLGSSTLPGLSTAGLGADEATPSSIAADLLS
jgi:hypothetical protein